MDSLMLSDTHASMNFHLREAEVVKRSYSATIELLEGPSRIALRGYYQALLIPFLVVFLLASSTWAQTTTSTIEGTVRDPNGAAIAGATVKATEKTLATD